MSTTESEELEKLRELNRLLNQKNEDLARENENLKKPPPEIVKISRANFQLKDVYLLESNSSQIIEMCGVKVTMHTEPLLDQNGVTKIFLWFQFNSPKRCNASISCRIMKLNYRYRTTTEDTVTVDVKFVREARDDTFNFDSGGKIVDVKVEEKIFKVNVSYISAWSDFFPIYFASEMKEAQEEIFGIEDYTAEQFQEMLDVINPTSKPIDRWNVMYLIEMAERFLMPSLTLKCEMFLADTTKHNFSDLQLLQTAAEFGLIFTQNIVLDRTTVENLQKVTTSSEYEAFPAELKRDIDARFVELYKNTPRESTARRNNHPNNRQRGDEMSRDDGRPRDDYHDRRQTNGGMDIWEVDGYS